MTDVHRPAFLIGHAVDGTIFTHDREETAPPPKNRPVKNPESKINRKFRPSIEVIWVICSFVLCLLMKLS